MNWLRRFFGMAEPESDFSVTGDITIANGSLVATDSLVSEEITAEVEYNLYEIPKVSGVMRGTAKIQYSDGHKEEYSNVYFVYTGEKAMRAHLREDVKTHVEYYRRRKAGKGTWTEKM